MAAGHATDWPTVAIELKRKNTKGGGKIYARHWFFLEIGGKHGIPKKASPAARVYG